MGHYANHLLEGLIFFFLHLDQFSFQKPPSFFNRNRITIITDTIIIKIFMYISDYRFTLRANPMLFNLLHMLIPFL
ncbi:hypothetical protein C1Y18_34495 [Pseudomonas sp. MPR-R5A]|nr:hypothetical protein C1Y18_34495 [Pseudomonas sp. MPR-R5A]